MLEDMPNKTNIENKYSDNQYVTSKLENLDPALIGKMKTIISKYTDRPHLLDDMLKLSDDTNINFIKELNIDSVDVVEIVVDVEEEFNITISDDEIGSFKSFGDMYSLIEKKIAELESSESASEVPADRKVEVDDKDEESVQ